MKSIFVNVHPWGRWKNFLYALAVLADALVRTGSLGFLATTWPSLFVRREGEKVIQKAKAARAEK